MDLFEVINENEYFRVALNNAIDRNIVVYDAEGNPGELSNKKLGLFKVHFIMNCRSKNFIYYIPNKARDSIIHVISPVEDYLLLKDMNSIFGGTIRWVDDNQFVDDYYTFYSCHMPYRANNICMMIGDLYNEKDGKDEVLLGAF